jgi:hypothetical protein
MGRADRRDHRLVEQGRAVRLDLTAPASGGAASS